MGLKLIRIAFKRNLYTNLAFGGRVPKSVFVICPPHTSHSRYRIYHYISLSITIRKCLNLLKDIGITYKMLFEPLLICLIIFKNLHKH